MTLAFGYVLVIVALVMVFDFFASKKSLMEYIKFVGAVLLLIVGICALVFRSDLLAALALLFGLLLILDGGRLCTFYRLLPPEHGGSAAENQ